MENKYQYGTEENQRFLQEQRNAILKFGQRFPSSEGGSYYLGDDGTPWIERPRETWITARMAHVYSLAVMLKEAGADLQVKSGSAVNEEADHALKEDIGAGLPGKSCSAVNEETEHAVKEEACAGLPGKSCSAVKEEACTGLPGKSCSAVKEGTDYAVKEEDCAGLSKEAGPVVIGKDVAANLAEKAIQGLRGELHDDIYGGWYAGRCADGSIMPEKQCYAHAFVILAASSGMLAGIPGAEELYQDACNTYDVRFWNEEEGLACDSWNREFTCCSDYRGLNANMHSVEAFLAAADAGKILKDKIRGEKKPDTAGTGIRISNVDVTEVKNPNTAEMAPADDSLKENAEKYRIRAGRIIDHVIAWAEQNNWRIPEHYTKDWGPDLNANLDKPDDPFKPYGATPGHGIEWARLIIQYALSSEERNISETKNTAIETKNTAIETKNIPVESESVLNVADFKNNKYLESAEKLFCTAFTDGWNSDGAPGICYTTDWNGKPVVHDRMHWTLAEAINTLSVLCRLTGKEQYYSWYSEVMQYLDQTVADHQHGSWYHQLNRNNQVIGTVWPGKSDLYHAFQSMLIPYYPADISIASAVRQ